MPLAPYLVHHRNSGAKVAIVFVHGFSGKPDDTWRDFAQSLAAEPDLNNWDLFSAGYSTNLRIDLAGFWSAETDLALITTLLHTTLTIDPLAQYEALALFAHSMGGLVVQRLVLDYEDIRKITTHVILFGTPSDGLRKAGMLWRLKKQLRDMARGGPFIQSLRHDWNARFGAGPPFLFRVVAGENDEFAPTESSLQPFPPQYRESIAGNHLAIVRARDGSHPGVRLAVKRLTGDESHVGKWDSARLAVETNQFRKAIEMLEPNADALDDDAAVQLAIALEKRGRQQDAIDLLTRRTGSHTDAMGTLAGRLKRRWLRERINEDAERALELYKQAYDLSAETDPHQAYYHAINVAFLQLVFRKKADAVEQWARRALQHCAQAAAIPAPGKAWRLATEGEANLLLGNFDEGVARYRDAIATEPDSWQIESMFLQATEIARQLENKALAKRVAETFDRTLQ